MLTWWSQTSFVFAGFKPDNYQHYSEIISQDFSKQTPMEEDRDRKEVVSHQNHVAPHCGETLKTQNPQERHKTLFQSKAALLIPAQSYRRETRTLCSTVQIQATVKCKSIITITMFSELFVNKNVLKILKNAISVLCLLKKPQQKSKADWIKNKQNLIYFERDGSFEIT